MMRVDSDEAGPPPTSDRAVRPSASVRAGCCAQPPVHPTSATGATSDPRVPAADLPLSYAVWILPRTVSGRLTTQGVVLERVFT